MAKIGVVLAGMMLTMVLAVGLGMSTSSSDLAAAVAVAGSIVTVLFCTRVFRGDSEEAAPPRSWGRLTEKPTAGYVLAGWFALQAVSLVFLDTAGPAIRALGALAYGLLAWAFARSSSRLSAT